MMLYQNTMSAHLVENVAVTKDSYWTFFAWMTKTPRRKYYWNFGMQTKVIANNLCLDSKLISDRNESCVVFPFFIRFMRFCCTDAVWLLDPVEPDHSSDADAELQIRLIKQGLFSVGGILLTISFLMSLLMHVAIVMALGYHSLYLTAPLFLASWHGDHPKIPYLRKVIFSDGFLDFSLHWYVGLS